ncbi:hypothetical protein PDESU_01808 [Pontiella desulfatans]|uniref:PEP-CTERM protein-sorting domain-containing protein n=1 Tax=Pontiella desulfatans TaxID=2750659 RepID=A0A6C2U008_PONDE|nr:hypothetical protein [Pontiella desulfatans]VGO13252.1 hypothetical protein PDESU_01808 [Pontiella desulfatans]
MKKVWGIILVLGFAVGANAGIILTGVLDGDLSGGTPKVVELYVDGTEDLANYKFAYQQNAGTSWSFSSTLSGTYTDEFVYLVDTDNDDEFASCFGSSGDFANVLIVASIAHNGDDRVGIATSSDVLVDYYGAAGVDGSGQSWEYTDGFAYRDDGTGPDGTFAESNWDISLGGVDGLDAAGHGATVPFGTYAIPEPMTLSFIALFGGGLLFVRRLFSMG